MGQAWMTVYRMLKSDAGLLNPEDPITGPPNRDPRQRSSLRGFSILPKQRHEVRATLYTLGSLIVIYMAAHVLVVAIPLV